MQLKDKYSFEDFKSIVKILRGENGCPWDKEQTIESLQRFLIEEAYESVEASEKGGICHADELGDLLLQIVMQAEIAGEQGSFTMDEVITCISKKMITRHPHVFSDVVAKTPEKVLQNWEKIKRSERGIKNHAEVMKGVSKGLTALMRAEKLQEKAAKAGFDWDDVSGALDKLVEETAEIKEAIKSKNKAEMEAELGDVLFSAVNISRFINVSAEIALEKSNKKFIDRFSKMEALAADKGRKLEDMTLVEMDMLWNEVK